MATHSQARSDMTLEEFLQWSRIDEKPYLEYYDGRIEEKVSPQRKHSVIEARLSSALNQVAEPLKIGLALPELRCTFGGQSIVPDILFHLDEHIPCGDSGEFLNESLLPPDIHVEIRSPEQWVRNTREKLEHSIANGCPLGWYIDPERQMIEVYRPGLVPERLANDGFLDGSPVLPEFRLAVSDVFGWLIYRSKERRGPGEDPR